MAWLRFERAFDWDPAAYGGRVTIAFPAGAVRFVTRACAAAALATGAAVQVGRPMASPRPAPKPVDNQDKGTPSSILA